MENEIPGVNMEELRLQGFKVHQLPTNVDVPTVHGRRDFYKMGLITGEMTIGYGDQVLEVQDRVLFFVNPRVPRTMLRRSRDTTGYACIFTEAFMPAVVKKSPLFNTIQNPLVRLNTEQAGLMKAIFLKMLAVRDGDYLYNSELIKSCIELIIHQALLMQPPGEPAYQNGASRMTHLFLDMLERQFPVEHTREPLRLRTVQDFAGKLTVHVNYLNRVVKEVTGKPTSLHIAERIAGEAKALLQHTDWSIADIAYALGFAYPTYTK